jgi:hypothetical protein
MAEDGLKCYLSSSHNCPCHVKYIISLPKTITCLYLAHWGEWQDLTYETLEFGPGKIKHPVKIPLLKIFM